MIKRLVYNKKAFKILDGFTIKQSNAEVTFNDITIDFTGYSLLDIPFKYQELKIIQAETEEEILNENGEVVFTGFLDDIDLSEMKIRKEEQRELTLTVLSPLAMSTKRYVSLIGTYSKEEAIRRVLQPLLDDGFKIVEFNIPTGQITTNFVIESVENCMNDMCFKAGVFWFIDENKNIYINSIDYLFGLGSKKTIAPDVITKGLSKIQPKIENIDYANVINFKNVRIYYSTMSMCDELNNLIEEHDYPLLNLPKKLKKGDTVQFNNPIVVSEDTLRKLREEGEVDDADVASLSIIIGGEEFYIRIETNEKSADYDKYVTSNNFSFSNDGGEEKTLVLQRDSFYNNLITGFKWNGADNSVVSRIYTGTALRYTTMRFMYSAEINNLKGVISDTGIVEKCIDYQEKWTTTTQLIDYARTLMTSNTKTINQVDLTFDELPNLKIGDIVEIHEPDFYIDGKFAVKEISYKYINDENEEWNIKLKNSDLNSTYIDLFRPSQKQENESKTDTVVLSEYVEETVYEKHEIGEKETLIGEVIVVKDNDGLITIERINGAHLQKTTQGINLLEIALPTQTYKGVTFTNNGDGSFTLNGTATANLDFRVEQNAPLGSNNFNAYKGTYTFYCSNLKSGMWFGSATYDDGAYNFFMGKLQGNVSLLTREVDVGSGFFYIHIISGTTVNNLTLKPMFLKGTYTLETIPDFEPYTGGKPSPSTEYQQEIETVGSNVNLFDKDSQDMFLKGLIPDNTGKIVVGDTDTSGSNYQVTIIVPCLPDSTYIISRYVEGKTFFVYESSKKDLKVGDNVTFLKRNNNTGVINEKITTGVNAKYLLVKIYNTYAIEPNTYNDLISSVKVEKGTKATPYSPYGEGNVGVIKQNKNFLYYEAQNQSISGINYTVNSDKSIQVSGTATAVSDFYLIGSATNYEGTNLRGAYKISGCNSGTTSKYMLYVEKKNEYGTLEYYQNVSGDTEINIAEGDTLRIFIRVLSGVTVNDTIYPMLRLSTETDDTYVEAKKESYIIPVQQEMLEGDYIDSTEHHEWSKLILTGDETILRYSTNTSDVYRFAIQNIDIPNQETTVKSLVFCNILENVTALQTYLRTEGISGYKFQIIAYIKECETMTIEEFKAWLKEKYDAGTPIIIYYKLETPVDLELTDEQKAISKYLQPYDNGTTILVTDKLATITASYTKKGENDEN